MTKSIKMLQIAIVNMEAFILALKSSGYSLTNGNWKAITPIDRKTAEDWQKRSVLMKHIRSMREKLPPDLQRSVFWLAAMLKGGTDVLQTPNLQSGLLDKPIRDFADQVRFYHNTYQTSAKCVKK